MREYLELGPVPGDESCQQVGTAGYNATAAREEMHRYRDMLYRRFGQPPGNARFGIKSFPHDFGTYGEVCIFYNSDDQSESEFAYLIEGELPATWDEPDDTVPQDVREKLNRMQGVAP